MSEDTYVSRGGLKLRHALDEFGIDPAGLRCADLGCSTGGFTDCLVRSGAASVIALDTAYGQLDYRLRIDERVEVRERTNALHAEPPAEPVDLVVIDLGWTRQALAIPAAMRWIGDGGRIVSLVKPHYEMERAEFERLAVGGVLPESEAERVVGEVVDSVAAIGARVEGVTKSPILGGRAGKRRSKGQGNAEWLMLVMKA